MQRSSSSLGLSLSPYSCSDHVLLFGNLQVPQAGEVCTQQSHMGVMPDKLGSEFLLQTT